MPRIAIIGGGISGLSAAFTLEEKRRSGTPISYVLFEAAPRLGGVLVTDRVDDCLVEAGPDSFISEKPWAADLCRKIGLGDQLIGSNDADRKTYIVVRKNGRDRLVVMPDGLMFMVPTKMVPTVMSPLFSLGTKMRMAAEWFHLPHKASGDETVAQMVERHYGPEMVELLADPLLSGVYGGEASQLSVRAVLPRFAAMEAEHGSLGRAMLASRKKITAAEKGSIRPLFTSLKEGMQQMVDALVERLDQAALRTSSIVQSVLPQEGGWTVSAGYQSDQFDAVIVAAPAHAAAVVLETVDASLARELAEINYTSSVTLTLCYDEAVRRSLPLGFGFLVPRSAGHRMLAATFVHNKFPHRAPANRALVRCFLGGARDEEIISSSEEQILEIVRNELRQIVGIKAEPLFFRVYKWKAAMAQYAVGHLDRLARIQTLCERLPGLALAGNGFSGIGVPDCVRSGTEAATKVLSQMGMWSAA
ncbi:MAG: protoporphyrinogen oxidase [Terriglobales bacterium]